VQKQREVRIGLFIDQLPNFAVWLAFTREADADPQS
jgi:hypothetical protein